MKEIWTRWANPILNNGCANCGTLAHNAKRIFVGGWMCDEEFACSDACYRELEERGCPHETTDNYRPRPQEVLDHEFDLAVATANDIHGLYAALDAANKRIAELEAALRWWPTISSMEEADHFERRVIELLKEAQPDA